jgi:pimeloyl-ACP methyl ester carboxylesterase
MDRVPETRFARSGKRRIAYQVAGEGPVDLVFRGSWFLPVDTVWEWEPSAAFRGRLASFSRLVMFDRPGAGATDPLRPGGASEVEAWSDDLLAVLDEIGCTRAALLGSLDGGLFAIVFAATHPERTSALILGETTAYAGQVPGYPGGIAAPPGQDGRSLWESWGSEGSNTMLGRWMYPAWLKTSCGSAQDPPAVGQSRGRSGHVPDAHEYRPAAGPADDPGAHVGSAPAR